MGKAYKALSKHLPELNSGLDPDPDREDDNGLLTGDERIGDPTWPDDGLGNHPNWSLEIQKVAASIDGQLGFSDKSKWMRDLKKVASNIAAMEGDEEFGKIFLVTSTERGSGATSVCVNTARLLAANEEENKVLLLDVSKPRSMSEPRQQRGRVRVRPGAEPRQPNPAQTGGISLLTANITEKQLQSPVLPGELKAFLRDARRRYRWILIDAPPFSLFPALFALARETDGVIIVARSGVTRLPAITALSNDLIQLGAHPLGVVMNFRRYPIPKFLLKLF